MKWTRKMTVNVPTGWVREEYTTPSGHKGVTNKLVTGDQSAYVEFEIDQHRLEAALAFSAMRNKSGRSRFMSGIITAKVTARDR